MTIGERIKYLRDKHDMSQLALAEKIGMNNSVLSRIESGKRPVEDQEIIKFAEVFGVSSDYLLGRTIYTETLSDGKDEFTNEELAILAEIRNNPEVNVFFKDYASAPIEKQKEMVRFWKIIKASEEENKE